MKLTVRTFRSSFASLSALASLAAISCGSKGSVTVTGAIASTSVSIERPSALASRLGGSFVLHLELGPVASAGTDVSLSEGNFSLVRAADQKTLVLLKLRAEPMPPYHLEPGGTAEVKLTIADQPGTVGQIVTDEAAAICDTRAAVQIAGSFTDSASGKPTPVASTTFAVTGCE